MKYLLTARPSYLMVWPSRPRFGFRSLWRRDRPADLVFRLGLLEPLRILLMQSSEVDAARGIEPEKPVGLPGVLRIAQGGFEVGSRSSPDEELVLEDHGIDEADELVLGGELHEFFEDGGVLVGFQAAAGFDEVLRHDEAVEVVGEGLEFGVDDFAEDFDFGARPGERGADAAEDNEFVE